MKFRLSIIVFALLQLGLPSGIAVSEDESNQEDDARNLRGGGDVELANENEDLALSEETGRELMPFGYPSSRRRPGQTQRYGLDSLVGFRPYTNPNSPVIQQQQILPNNQRTGGIRGHGFAPPPKRFAPPPKKFGPRPKGFHKHPNQGFVRTNGLPKRKNGDFDGNFVIGVTPPENSLAASLGFIRVPQGSTVVFVEDLNDDDATASPITTAPSISQSPTTTPTIAPTKAPVS